MANSSCEELLCFDSSGLAITRKQIVVNEWQSLRNITQGNIVLKQRDTFLVMINADERLFETILVQNVNGNLVLDIDEDCLKNVDVMEFTISMPEFTGLNNQGKGNFTVTDTLTTTEVSFANQSSGNIAIANLRANTIHIDNKSSGRIELEGIDTTEVSTISNSGSGKVDVENLICREITATCSGSGHIYIHCTDILNVNILGSGNIYYRGNPIIQQNITGSGQLIKLN